MSSPRSPSAPGEARVRFLTAALDAFPTRLLTPPPPPEPPAGFRRVILRRDRETEVTAVSWLGGVESGLHGHNGSAALYRVVAGALEEERFLPQGGSYRYEVSVLRPGQVSYLPPGSFHRVRSLVEAFTVHAYDPPPDDPSVAVPEGVVPLLERARLCAGGGTANGASQGRRWPAKSPGRCRPTGRSGRGGRRRLPPRRR
jgi:hypothetical protein